jgi:hypothetical protein
MAGFAEGDAIGGEEAWDGREENEDCDENRKQDVSNGSHHRTLSHPMGGAHLHMTRDECIVQLWHRLILGTGTRRGL